MNTTQSRQRLDTRVALALFCALTCFFLLTSSGHIQTTDGETAYQTTEALVERGTFRLLPPEIAGDSLRSARLTRAGYYGITGPLHSILAMPFYLVGMWVSQAFSPPFTSYFTRFFVVLTNSLIHALTTTLLYLMGRDLGYRRRTSLFIALAYGLATMAWPYSRTFFADTPLTFWLVLGAWAICRYTYTEQWGWMVLVGMALGLGITNKYVMAFALPAFALYLMLIGWQQGDWRARQQWAIRTLVSGGLPFMLIVVTLAIFNITRFSHPLETGYTGGDPLASAVGRTRNATPLLTLYGFFFSSGKGFFFFSPPAIVSLWGIGALIRRRRNEAILLLAIAISAPLVYSLTKANWYGGANWGPRHILCSTPFLMLFLGAYLERQDISRWWRVGTATTLFLVGFWIQTSVVMVNYSSYLFGTIPFMDQIFHPPDSPLAAQWVLWPQQVRGWQAYDHNLRASGAEFYQLGGDFYAVEIPERAPFGRWMSERGEFRIYAQPEQALTVRVAYSRPRQADAGAADWVGLQATYDGARITGERQFITENEHETQWQETFNIAAEAVHILPGTLEITATTRQPHEIGDPRNLSIFIADVQILKDGAMLPFNDAPLPRPLPVSMAYRWSWDAMFWFYDPAVARPFDVWPWYVWTSGLPLPQARAFIFIYGGVLLTGFLASLVWFTRTFNAAISH